MIVFALVTTFATGVSLENIQERLWEIQIDMDTVIKDFNTNPEIYSFVQREGLAALYLIEAAHTHIDSIYSVSNADLNSDDNYEYMYSDTFNFWSDDGVPLHSNSSLNSQKAAEEI